MNISLTGSIHNSPLPSPVPATSPVPVTANQNDISVSYEGIKKMKWQKGNYVSQPHQLRFCEEALPQAIQNLSEPIEFLQLYLTSQFMNDLAFQTNLYARQQGKLNINITPTQLRQYIAVLIFMGVISVKNVRLYWNNIVGVPCVKDTLSQKQFESIRSYLHFNDNDAMICDKKDTNYDRLYKVRPIIKHFNEVSSSIPYPRDMSVDENICATKMRSSLKQYNPKKPHKWGFKLFMLCGTDGFICNTEVYSGQENEERFRPPNEPDLQASSNIVVRMVRNVPRNCNHRIYFDNYFSSLALVHYLAKMGIYSLGTVRRNRIGNSTLPKEAELKKKKRGVSFERMGIYKGIPITTVLWKDNTYVTLISSYVGKLPVTKVRRFLRSQKKHVEVNCSAIICEYNRFMGGVDLLGSHIGRGRIQMKSRKWPVRIFHHYLDLMVVNAWLLYKRTMNSRPITTVALELRDFRIQCAVSLAKMGTKISSPSGKGRPAANPINKRKRLSYLPPKPVRCDQVGHLPQFTTQRQRCKNEIMTRGVTKCCNKLTKAKCIKCNTYLCLSVRRNCFLPFHKE